VTAKERKLLLVYMARVNRGWLLTEVRCDVCRLPSYGLIHWLKTRQVRAPGTLIRPYLCKEHAQELSLMW
jgi:hypothetical protein